MGEYDGKFSDIFHQLDRVEVALLNGNLRMNTLAELQARHSEILDAHHKRSTKLESVVEESTKESNVIKMKIAQQYSDIKMNIASLHSRSSIEIAKIQSETKLEIEKIHADILPVKNHVRKMGWLASLLEMTPTILKITATILTIISAGAGAYYTPNYLLR